VKELVSVIVPVYNVEEYLSRCIDSIINQTYKNLEIILVDDGSPDGCPKICDEYAKKDKRIKVIHKENGGLSSARNAGLDLSNGKFLCFIDSDDFIDKNMIKVLLDNLKKTSSDMSVCSYKKVSDSKMLKIDLKKEIIDSYDKKQCFYNLYNELSETTELAWNKLYKRELWKNLKYPNGKIHEDAFVIHHLINKCQKVVYTNLELCYYFNRENSIMKTFNVKRLDAIDALDDRRLFFKSINDSNLYFKSCIYYLKSICFIYIDTKKYSVDIKIKKQLKNRFISSYKEIKKEINIPLKNKIQFYLMINLSSVYRFIRKICGRS